MTHSYYQWSVSSPDPAPTVDSPSYRFNLSPGATNAATAPVSTSTGNLSAETGVVWIQFMTPSSNNVPGTAHSGGWPGVATWPTGTYDILYNITSAGANMQMGAQTIGTVTGHFARTNQAGTSHVATVAADSAVQTGTGLKTTSISSWSPSGSTWDDRFEVLLVAYRDDPGGHGNETAIIETNDPDADSTIGGIARGPWSTTPPALTGNISRVGTPTWVEKTDATSGDPAVVSAYPTGVQADDYILAVVIHSDGTNPTITAPAGFTSVGSSNDGNSKLEVFEYFYVGSGDPSLSFYGSVTNDTTVLVVAYRGVSTTDTRYGLTTQTAATPGSLLSITKDAGDRAGIAFLGQGVDPSIQMILPPAFKYTSGDPQPNTMLFPDESNLRRERDTAPITTPSIIQAQDFDIASGAGTHRIWSDLGEASVLHGVFFLIQEAEAGTTVAVNVASETEAAQTVGVLQEQIVAVGAASETEVAQTVAVVQVGPPQSIAVGVTSETETANSVPTVASISVAAAVASETESAVMQQIGGNWSNTAEATTPSGAVAIGVASETETAQTVVVNQSQSIAVGVTSETEAAVAVAADTTVTITVGVTSETEAAQPVAVSATVTGSVGVTSETETANAIAADSTVSVTVAVTSETETAEAVTAATTVATAVVVATETESAQAVTADTSITVNVGAVAETESATAVAVSQATIIAVGVASESETAQAVPFASTVTTAVAVTSETETANAVGAQQVVVVGSASETEAAQSVTFDTTVTVPVVVSTETEAAQPVAADTTVTVGVALASEVESAFAAPPVPLFTVNVGVSNETETANAILIESPVLVAVAAATEVESAIAVVAYQTIKLLPNADRSAVGWVASDAGSIWNSVLSDDAVFARPVT